MLAKTPNRKPDIPSLDEDARNWFDALLRSQLDCLEKKGNLREALLVMSGILQEKLQDTEQSPFYRRIFPWAGGMELLMRGIAVSMERPYDTPYIRSKIELGASCIANWTKKEEENPSDPLAHPLAYVDVGTHADLIALCDEIEQKVQPLNESVIQLMLRHFKPSKEGTLAVYTFTMEELGLKDGGGYGDVMRVANEFGLDALPIDASLHLLMRPMNLFGTDRYMLVTESIGTSLCIFNSEKGLDLAVMRHGLFGPKTRLILRRKYS